MKKIFLYVLVSMFPLILPAQETWEGSIMLGYSNYLGDLVVPGFTLDHSSFSAGILVRKRFSRRFGMRVNFLYGNIEGNDRNYDRNVTRGAVFSAPLAEISVQAEYDFLGHKRWDENGRFKPTFSPYLFAGAGGSYFDLDVAFTSDPLTDAVKADIAADYSTIHFSGPVGLGLRLDLNRRMNLGLEAGFRVTFSDYLDGVSVSGEPDNNDVYYIGGVILGVALGSLDADNDGVADMDDKCPTIPGLAVLEGCPDSDGDGIADEEDDCPLQAGEVRLKGCPDSDGDGISDHLDDCPEDAGLRRFAGCPDTDNDNIVDKEDNCPNLPGIPALNGCPDKDRDGVTDAKDNCPDIPGSIEMMGCPDSDNDGIPDNEDQCPKEPGQRKMKGCPDTDQDGIADDSDKCPTVPGPASNSGCPEIANKDREILTLAMQNVQFQSGSAELLNSSLSVLNQVGEVMSRYEGYHLQIDGYTDNIGDYQANQLLSEARAKSCFDYLVRKGVNPNAMSFAGHGENDPIESNDTQEGRLRNRRVEFTLKIR